MATPTLSKMLSHLVLFACFLRGSFAVDPIVQLNGADITGVNDGSVSKFLGIPYASPPIGNLRFRLPVPLEIFADLDAKSYGPTCPQQHWSGSPFSGCFGSVNVSALVTQIPEFQKVPRSESEDCLTINVIRPSFAKAGNHYPVVVWFYGGAFQRGDTETYDPMGVRIVERSTALGTPVIFVSMNHRVSAFGFLGGQQVYEEQVGNLGLWDQRVALRWVKKHIASFGGNSSQITMWGQSSGSISIALQLIGPDNGSNEESLFHSAFMQSGAVIPVGDIRDGQKYYDFLASETGCAKPNFDTLSCLRGVDYPILKAAVDKSPNFGDYQSLSLAWVPRADGVFLKDDPQKLVQLGLVAKVPFVSGSVDDEGTFFACSSTNVTTEADFRKYVSEIFVPKAPVAELENLWTHYPSTPSEGSPFGTGNITIISPQFKRMAAFQGDVVFQAPTRFFSQTLAGKQKIWSFLSKKLKLLPVVGSAHGTDLILNLTDDYLIRFVVNHDPNNGTGPVWPQYTNASPQRYTFPSLEGPTISLDTQRAAQMAYLTNLSLFYPI